MAITVHCPNCSKAFPVDPDKVPDEGVNARCSACSTVFFVEKPRPVDEVAVEVPEDEEAPPASRPGPEEEAGPRVAVEPDEEGEPGAAAESVAAQGAAVETPEPSEARGVEEEEEEAEEGPEESTDDWVIEREREAGTTSVDVEPMATVETSQGGIDTEMAEEVEHATPPEPEEAAGAGVAEPEASPAETEEEKEEEEEEEEGTAAPDAMAPGEGEVVEESQVFEGDGTVPEAVPDPDAKPAGFQFGKRDPKEKAQRLARVLVSDMIMYNPERHSRALEADSLKEDFEDEIEKSWEEYVEQVGEEMANETSYFTDALNDILAKGEEIFTDTPPS